MANTTQSKYTVFNVHQECELLPFIEKVLNGMSHNKAKAILTNGEVMVDKHIETQHNFLLKPGMVVEISKRKPGIMLHNKFVKIIYEDRDIIVIDKSPGILSAPAPHQLYNVKTILDSYLKASHQKCTSHVVHRLDRDTSGIMVYAKNMNIEQVLEHSWKDIVIDRRYIALVEGKMEQQNGSIESWLKEDERFITYSSPFDNGGKYALTHFRTVKSNERYSLVELRLETGRKNQIRVHMQDIGHPICGDIKYGNNNDEQKRMYLHAFRLVLHHPRTNELLRFETPYPKEFMQTYNGKK